MKGKTGVKVSVVVPVYNAERTLGECLDGILAQTLRETEIICVDDGSTDGSAAVLEAYRRKDGRIRALRQENRGAGAARNTGLAEARGEFLSFLDADDRFEPDLLERAYGLCRETGADICAYAADSFDAQTGKAGSYGAAFDKSCIPASNPFDPASDEVRETLLQMFNGVPWNKLFRTSFIRETGLSFQPLRTTNDAFFVYCSLCRAKKIATLDRVLVHRRKNGAGSLTQSREKSWRCFYDALAAIRDELDRCGILDLFARTFAIRALQNAVWNMETVPSACAEEIAGLMKREGFARFGIAGHGEEYFRNPALYERYEWLRDLNADACAALLKVARERDALKEETRKLRQALAAGRSWKARLRSSLPFRFAKALCSLFRFPPGRGPKS